MVAVTAAEHDTAEPCDKAQGELQHFWRHGVMREVRAMGLLVDPDRFSLTWRAGHMPAMQQVMSGQIGWLRIDDLHWMILDGLLGQFKLTHLSAAYQGVAQAFDVTPDEVMRVAAHQDDLAHARAAGLKTAYIERPLEFGPAQPKDVSAHPDNTFHARDLNQLAELLGC